MSKVPVSHHMMQLKRDNFSKVMNNKENQWRLFPHGFVVIGKAWIPLKIIPDNYDIMLKEMGSDTPIFYTVKYPDSFPVVESLSFSDAIQITKGIRYCISYYGYDIANCLAHVLNHLKNIHKFHTNGIYTVDLLVPMLLDTNAVQMAVQEFFNVEITEQLTCCIFQSCAQHTWTRFSKL